MKTPIVVPQIAVHQAEEEHKAERILCISHPDPAYSYKRNHTNGSSIITRLTDAPCIFGVNGMSIGTFIEAVGRRCGGCRRICPPLSPDL